MMNKQEVWTQAYLYFAASREGRETSFDAVVDSRRTPVDPHAPPSVSIPAPVTEGQLLIKATELAHGVADVWEAGMFTLQAAEPIMPTEKEESREIQVARGQQNTMVRTSSVPNPICTKRGHKKDYGGPLPDNEGGIKWPWTCVRCKDKGIDSSSEKEDE